MPAPTLRHTPSLARALALPRAGVVAFVGAGGKTSSIRRLLGERPEAIATTTTHLACSGFARGLLGAAPDAAALEAVERALLRASPCTLALRGDGTRLHAPDSTWHERFARRHPDRLVLVEADGAARRALKLPAAHEPAWHPCVDVAVVVLGGHALGRALADVAHHPERFRAAHLGREAVEVEHLAAMLTAYVHKTPPGVALRVLVRGVGAHADRAVRELAAHAQRVVRQRDPLWNDPAASLRVVALGEDASACATWGFPSPERRKRVTLAGVCGVLLAAGHGSRFEGAEPSKLLARWRGRTLVAHATRTWSRAGFAEMLLVTGHACTQVEDAARRAAPEDTRMRRVHNRQHRRGLGTSVRAAARRVPPGMGMLFGHADMPALRVETLQRIAGVGLRLRDRIVVPHIGTRPANPVYFPPDLRTALQRCADDAGGRSVWRAERARVFALEMPEPDDLVDVDRVSDLERLR